MSALLLSPLLAVAFTAPPEKPRRRPSDAATFEAEVRILRSQTALAETGDRPIRLLLWYMRERGRRFVGGADARVPLGSGGAVEYDEVSFVTDAELDPIGEREDLSSGTIARLLARPLASSDLALLPLRAVLRHETAFESGRREVVKERSLEGGVVRMWEKRLGLQRIGPLTLDQRVTRSERHLRPSGHRLLDVCFTCEDPDEGQVLYAQGVRLLVAPTRPVGRDDPLAASILAHLEYRVCQVGWKVREPPVPDGERHVGRDQWPTLEARFRASLGNAILDGLPDDGLGDPFDAPWAYLLGASGTLDERFAERLARLEDRRALSAAAPALLSAGVAADPDAVRGLLRRTEDPVRRILLGALLARSGETDPAAQPELRVARASRHPAVEEALAFVDHR